MVMVIVMIVSVDIPWHADSPKSQGQWQLFWPIRVNQPEVSTIRHSVCPPTTVCNHITSQRIFRISALDHPKVKRKSDLFHLEPCIHHPYDVWVISFNNNETKIRITLGKQLKTYECNIHTVNHVMLKSMKKNFLKNYLATVNSKCQCQLGS